MPKPKVKAAAPLTARKRFFIGGAGALMPIVVTLLSIDLVTMINDWQFVTAGHVIGFSLRYSALFILGGVIAWLHEDEAKSYKLFQIGIAAPALVTSFVSANSIKTVPAPTAAEVRPISSISSDFDPFSFSLISSAHAQAYSADGIPIPERKPDPSFFRQVIQGISGGAYQEIYSQKMMQQQQQVPLLPALDLGNVDGIEPAAGVALPPPPPLAAGSAAPAPVPVASEPMPDDVHSLKKQLAFERMEKYRIQYEQAKQEYQMYLEDDGLSSRPGGV